VGHVATATRPQSALNMARSDDGPAKCFWRRRAAPVAAT
jgi:hypothetical protein